MSLPGRCLTLAEPYRGPAGIVRELCRGLKLKTEAGPLTDRSRDIFAADQASFSPTISMVVPVAPVVGWDRKSILMSER